MPLHVRPDPIRLDLQRGVLLRGDRAVPLRPKTWSVLVYLASRPGTLVSRDDLLRAVWPDVAITDETVGKSISELRAALGDDHRVPRFIETVNRRGYRLLADLRAEPAARGDRPSGVGSAQRPFVGRDEELRLLAAGLAAAQRGERQILFVDAPPGFGKTALVEAFLETPAVRALAGRPWIGRAACFERHGPTEPYQPILDALEDLARSPDAAPRLVPLMRRFAPMWLAQMPWLIGEADAHALRGSLEGVRPERMPRELAALLEAVTADHPLLLVLEDLHWGDPATVDALLTLAQRPGRQRLLVIGTCRGADAEAYGSAWAPALRTLVEHRLAALVRLHPLSENAVRDYLAARFPGHRFPPGLAPLIRAQTDGQPLFLVAILDHMVSRGWVLETMPGWALSVALETIALGVPDDVRRVIEMQLSERNPAERAVLEVASVAGGEITARVAAAVLGLDTVVVEQQCENLTRAAHLLRASGTVRWPDGSETARYAFVHQLHCLVARDSVPAERQARLRQRLGDALEAPDGAKAARIAPHLAAHVRHGADPARAAQYLMLAGVEARKRFAGAEAIAYFESALAMIALLPEAAERGRREKEVRLALGRVLADHEGFAAESVRVNYERVSVLCEAAGDERSIFEATYARWYLHAQRAQRRETLALVAELQTLARRLATVDEVVLAESALVRTALYDGRFADIRPHMETLMAHEDERSHAGGATRFGADPVVAAIMHHAIGLWFLGDPAGASGAARGGVARARATGSPFFLAAALVQAAIVEYLRRDGVAAGELAAEASRLAGEQGFTFWHAYASMIAGGALVQRGEAVAGSQAMARGLEAMRATGVQMLIFPRAFLAEGHLRAGAFQQGLAAVDAGLAQSQVVFGCGYEPELWRLRGELALATGADWTIAEACLLRALEMANAAQAMSLVLRAGTSLARAWHARGRHAEADVLLAETCERCASQAGSPDFLEARALAAPSRP